MNKKMKQGLILGSLLSISLLIYVLAQLNWASFLASWQTLQFSWLLLAALLVLLVLALRALRWLLVTQISFRDYIAVWQATNIGYLGNLIYPARAGELLRIVAFSHFTDHSLGRTLSGSVLDRVMDMLGITVVLLLVLNFQASQQLEADLHLRIQALTQTLLIVVFSGLLMLLFALPWLQQRCQQWQIQVDHTWWQRLKKVLLQIFQGAQPLRNPVRLISVILLTVLVFSCDYALIWLIFHAFGWTLPYSAAITTGAFMMLGSALPAAPGYIGVYQLAAVWGLGLYHLPAEQAVAFSLVYQLMIFMIIGIQGSAVVAYKGFALSLPNTEQPKHKDTM